jgi:hypothetical protein
MPPGQDGIIAFAAHTNKGARLRPRGVGGIEREYIAERVSGRSATVRAYAGTDHLPSVDAGGAETPPLNTHLTGQERELEEKAPTGAVGA